MEPAEIRQLRLQVHQYGELIAAGNRDQKHCSRRSESIRDEFP